MADDFYLLDKGKLFLEQLFLILGGKEKQVVPCLIAGEAQNFRVLIHPVSRDLNLRHLEKQENAQQGGDCGHHQYGNGRHQPSGPLILRTARLFPGLPRLSGRRGVPAGFRAARGAPPGLSVLLKSVVIADRAGRRGRGPGWPGPPLFRLLRAGGSRTFLLARRRLRGPCGTVRPLSIQVSRRTGGRPAAGIGTDIHKIVVVPQVPLFFLLHRLRPPFSFLFFASAALIPGSPRFSPLPGYGPPGPLGFRRYPRSPAG